MGTREKRHIATISAIVRTKARREAAIRTLVKCEMLLPKLERKARRLGAPPKPRSLRSVNETPAPALPTIEPQVAADGTPDFLREPESGAKKPRQRRKANAKLPELSPHSPSGQ